MEDERIKSLKKTEKEFKNHFKALTDDALLRFDGIPKETWDDMEKEMKEGGKGSGDFGHLGRPGAVGGSITRRPTTGITPQVWQRARKRPGFNTVRNAITYVRTNSVLPESAKINWHLALKGGGNLVGAGQQITTVASKPATGSTAIKVNK